MEEELRLRGYSRRTVQAYVQQAARFARRLGRDPREVGMEEVRGYLVEMTDREQLSTSAVNQAIHGLRFLYVEVLGREWSLGFRLQKRRRKPLHRVLASLPMVQQLLGHKSVKTTMLYTHVARSAATELTSPLDHLG